MAGWCFCLLMLGAMLVLLADRPPPWTGSRVAQWLGDRSYSLYLWHWPLYVALVYAELQRETLAIMDGMVMSVVLGHLSYRWIENPARWSLGKLRMGQSFAALLGGVGVVGGLAVGVRVLDGIAGRFSKVVESAAAEANNSNAQSKTCSLDKGYPLVSRVFGGHEWRAIAVGDSHVVATISALAVAQPDGDAGVVQWSSSGCAFVLGMRLVPDRLVKAGKELACNEFIEWARAQLNTLPGNTPVVIIGRYAAYAFGRNEDGQGIDVPLAYFSRIYPVTKPELLNEFAQHITRSACELAKRRTVYMMRPIPEMGFDVPKTQSRRMVWGMTGDVSISVEDYRRRNDWVWAAQNAARDRCGIKILDPTPYLCRDGRCYGSKNARPLYFDDNHLSEFGNKLLVPMFAEVFRVEP